MIGLMGLSLASSCTARVGEKDLIGEWALTDSSRHLFANGLPGLTPRLTLEGNHRFDAHSLPAEIVRTAVSDKGTSDSVVDGSGTWQLDGRVDPELRLRFTTINGQLADYGAQIAIPLLRSPMVLAFFRGDPDEAVMIEFSKR